MFMIFMMTYIWGFLKRTFDFILHPIRQWTSFLRRAVPWLQWLSSLKPEILAGVLTFMFLMIIWIAIRFAGSDGDASWQTNLQQSALILLIIVAISLGVYFFVRVLFAPPPSPYPDIDESWTTGLQEIQKAGLNIKNVPIYLVLGLSDTKQIRCFIEGSGKEFDVEGATGAGQTLIWYGSKEHVYIFLADVGNFTEFSTKSRKLPLMHEVDEKDFTSTANISQFYKVSDAVVDEAPIEENDAGMMATVRAADAMSRQPDPEPAGQVRPSRAEPLRETARAKTGEQRRRINHLSELICRTRDPVSPVNGIVLNIDVDVLESYPEEMARKLRDDLRGLATELGVICAATAVVSGLEKDQGFINFAERLVEQNGPEFGKSKFGKSYRTWTPPTAEQLEQVAIGAVEEFDHFTHLIFSKRDALSGIHIQGNRDLVLFLCRLYSTILPGLKILLGKGCSLPESANEVEFPRFSGCYFVGHDSKEEYFLEKVFDRIEENVAELEWTPKSLQSESNWRVLSSIGYLVGLASLIAVVAMFFFNWVPGETG